MKPTEFLNDWSPRDRSLAVGLLIHEQGICAGCGQPMHESTDPDGPDYSPEDSHCRGCEVLDIARSPEDKPGTSWYLTVKRHGSTE